MRGITLNSPHRPISPHTRRRCTAGHAHTLSVACTRFVRAHVRMHYGSEDTLYVRVCVRVWLILCGCTTRARTHCRALPKSTSRREYLGVPRSMRLLSIYMSLVCLRRGLATHPCRYMSLVRLRRGLATHACRYISLVRACAPRSLRELDCCPCAVPCPRSLLE